MFRPGEQADSPSLPGFSVDVKEIIELHDIRERAAPAGSDNGQR